MTNAPASQDDVPASGTAAPARPVRVFLSYSRDDRGFVDLIAEALEAHGVDVLIDRSSIRSGEEFWKRIEDLIIRCDILAFVLSPAAVESHWCLREISFARELEKRLVPISFRSAPGMIVPPELARVNFVNFATLGPAYAPVAEAAVALRQAEDAGAGTVESLTSDHERLLQTFSQNNARSSDWRKLVNQLLVAIRIEEFHWEDEKTSWLERAHKWNTSGRPGKMLMRASDVQATETWMAQRPRTGDVPALVLEYLRDSQKRERRRRFISLSLAVGVALVTGILAFAWYLQRNVAQENELEAEAQRDQAITALKTQSRMLIDYADQARQQGDRVGAALLTLEGLPDTSAPGSIRRNWPPVPELERNLYQLQPIAREMTVAPRPGPSDIMSFAGPSDRTLIGGDLVETGTGRVIRRLMEVPGALVKTIFFTRQGDRVVYLQDDRLKIADSKSGEELQGLVADFDDITRVSVDPSGKAVVTIHEDGSVRFQKIGSQPVLVSTPENDEDVWHATSYGNAVFSPAGTHFVVTTRQKFFDLWQAEDAQRLERVEVPDNVEGATFDPTGTRFLPEPNTNGEQEIDVTLQMYRTADGGLEREFVGHEGGVLDIEFLPDRRRMVTGSNDNTARIWDIRNGKLLRTLRRHTTDVVDVEIVGGNEDRLLTRGAPTTGREQEDEYLKLWDDDGRFIGNLDGPEVWVSDYVLAQGRTRLFVALTDAEEVNEIAVFDMETGRTTDRITGHQDIIRGLALTSDDARLLTIADDGTMRTWRTQKGERWRALLRAPIKPHQIIGTGPLLVPGVFAAAAVDPEGRVMVGLTEDGELIRGPEAIPVAQEVVKIFPQAGVGVRQEDGDLMLFDLFSDELLDRATASSEHVGLSPDGTAWAWLTDNGDVSIRRIGNGASQVLDLETPIDDFKLAPGGRAAAVVSNGRLNIWTHEGWKPLEAGALEGSGRIHSEHTGARFATVNREGRAAVWSWTGELIAEWQAVDDPIIRVMGRPHVAELLPGGSLLALVTGARITIWRIGNGVAERVAVLDGHRARSYAHRDLGAITYTYKTSITRLAASQSGQRLLSVATDGLGVIWDMSLLEAVGELKGHGATVGALRAGPVTSSSVPEVYYFNEIVDAVFSEDQNWIVTVSTDGTARVWPFFDSTQALVEHVKIVAPRCLTKSERQAARLDPDPPDWCIQSQKWPYAEKAQQ